jgi:DNA-binding response OmpR family regulator
MKKILLVDDSKAVHAYTTVCFNGLNVELSHVYNGQEAVELLSKNKDAFDIVLLDWEMPVLDGPSTYEKLKDLGVSPVVMMTTKNSPDDMMFMLNKGVSEYILKPFTSDILIEKVQTVLGEEFSHAK